MSGYSSIYKVERRVDTVIIEMDAHVAEKLVAVLARVNDETSNSYAEDGLNDLLAQLTVRQFIKTDYAGPIVAQMVRHPSKLYRVENDGHNLRVVSAF